MDNEKAPHKALAPEVLNRVRVLVEEDMKVFDTPCLICDSLGDPFLFSADHI